MHNILLSLNITFNVDFTSVYTICWNTNRILKIGTFMKDDAMNFTIIWDTLQIIESLNIEGI